MFRVRDHVVAVAVAMVLAGCAWGTWRLGWLWWFVAVEAAIAAFVYAGMRRSMLRLTWSSRE